MPGEQAAAMQLTELGQPSMTLLVTPLMPEAQPTVLIVGEEARNGSDLERSLADHGMQCERATSDTVGVSATAVAPDLILLIGDAAGEHCGAVMATLRGTLRERTPPVAVVTSNCSLATRLEAFRRGAVATFNEADEPAALAGELHELIQDLARGRSSASVGESSLDELLDVLSHELRAELCDDPQARPGPVRLLLGQGKPLAILLRDFVTHVKHNVVTAEPVPVVSTAEPAADEPPCDTLPEVPRGIDGMRIALADEDAGRADVVAQALRTLGATVLVTDLAPTHARLQLLRALDPQVLLAGHDQIPDRGLTLLRAMRDDYRLRWASLLVLHWEGVWPDESEAPAIEPLLGTLAGLTEVERDTEQRSADGLSFGLRLESIGPIRLLHALGAGAQPVRVLIQNSRWRIEVELCAGRVDSVIARPADGAHELTGLDALVALSVLHAGEVSVEPQASRPTGPALGSLDELLVRLDEQQSPVAPSLLPEARAELEVAQASSAVDDPRSVGTWARVRAELARPLAVGSIIVPLWVMIASGIGASLVLTLVTLRTLAFGGSSAAVARVASSMPSRSAGGASPLASARAPASPKTRLARAAAGEEAALDALLAIPPDQRTTDQAFAVASGQQARHRRELDRLLREVEADPRRLRERNVQDRLIAAARRPDTGAATLRRLAAIDAFEAPDLLYRIWTGTRATTPMTKLAESLLHTEAVKRRASPALAVALALRANTSCEETKRAVERAVHQGDRRALVPLIRLASQRGCGPHQRDCYACLRGSDLLYKAVMAVRRRPSPL